MPNNKKPGRPAHPDQLTPAEWRVVQSAQHGLSNPQIAKRLDISINAVKFHIANATQKLGVRNKRALLEWLGIPIDSAANTIKQVSENIMKHWYRDILELEHLYTFGTMAFFNCGDVRLMLSENDGISKDESIIYLKCNDIQLDYQRLKERGIKFSHAPHKIHKHDDGSEEWMAFFTDLEGRPLGLMCAYKPI